MLLVLLAAVLAHSAMLLPHQRFDADREDSSTVAEAPVQRTLTTEDYLLLVAPDRSYRPLTVQSYRIDALLGGRAWLSQLLQLACHLGAVVLCYALLMQVLSDRLLSACGAALFAVLPVHVDAVASPGGRASLLGGFCVLAGCLLVLANSKRVAAGRESLAIAFSVSLAILAGLFVDGSTAVALVLAFGLLALLRRPFPWITLASAASAVLAWLSVRNLAFAGGGRLSFVQNPLVTEDLVSRILNGCRLLGLYVWKVAFPLRLSADYSHGEVRVFPVSSAAAWILAVSCIGVLAGLLFMARRRSPLAFLGLFVFVIAIFPALHIASVQGPIFAERAAYTASFGLVLALCGFLSGFRRKAIFGLLGVLILVAGVRTWLRSHEWKDPIRMGLRMAGDAPRSTFSQLRTAGACARLKELVPAAEKPALLARAKEHLDKALAIHPLNGRAEELYARVLFAEKRYEEALARFTQATSTLAQQDIPEVEPVLYRLRGECYLRIGQPQKAIEDFDPYLLLLSHQKSPPDPLAHNYRGLALAMQGKLSDALVEFGRAIEIRDDIPEFWNNRGFCRYRLKDLRGAISDYERGLDLCRKEGILRSNEGESVLLFLKRIASVEEEIARMEGAAGNAEASRAAADSAARRKAEASSLSPTGR